MTAIVSPEGPRRSMPAAFVTEVPLSDRHASARPELDSKSMATLTVIAAFSGSKFETACRLPEEAAAPPAIQTTP